jgi:alpha-L-fucosidase
MTYRSPENILHELIELSSLGGNLLLNISPMGDGSIPEAQQKTLLAIGEWLKINGEGIYGSHPWVRYGEGPGVPTEPPGDWKGGSTAHAGPPLKRQPSVPITEAEFRFTTANNNLYAFGYKHPQDKTKSNATIRSLSTSAAKVERVTLLGLEARQLQFHQSAEALIVTMPPLSQPSPMPFTLRIEGSHPIGAM